MTRRKRYLLAFAALGCGAVALSAAVCGLFGKWGEPEGSPALAAMWATELAQYRTPEEAQARNSKVRVGRFPSGEWLFGLARDSHGLWADGGGTVVLKDSRGQVRAFFGHVCGPNALPRPYKGGMEWLNLDRYYDYLADAGFHEHPLP